MRYKIFITKSHEAALTLSHAFKVGNGINILSWGAVNGNKLIPAIYHNNDYFYCAVEYRDDIPGYELIIC